MGIQDVRNQFRRSRLGGLWILINLTIMAGSIAYIYGHLFHQDLRTFFLTSLLELPSGILSQAQLSKAVMPLLSQKDISSNFYAKQIYIFRSFFFSLLINLLTGLSSIY